MEKEKVAQYINRKQLLQPTDKVLVALSGGADSVALLRLLQASGYDCEAAHCNFHLRGAESDRDEAFVRQLCVKQQVPLHTVHFDTARTAEERHISIEMAARELRYGWFEEIRQKINADAIAVAHHQDDSVETLLLNLIRGTGINGLRGIRPKNGHIVRPLLCLERKEIISYLNRIGQDYVTDSTNLQDEYTRNKIRLNLLPMMQEPAPATLLFEILYPLGFNTAQIRDIYRSLERQPGKIFTSEHWCIVKDREYLLIEAHRHPIQPALAMEEYVFTPDFVIPRDKNTACFDADKLTHPLLLRPWRQGDSFIPFGMKGRKKVSDYMTDQKFSLLRKEQQWVLCCGEEIIWLIGERTDNRFRIGASTKRVLTVRLLPAGDSPVTP